MFSDEAATQLLEQPVSIPALDHDWGEWTVTTKPTITTEGVETCVCSRDSSHTETRAVPKQEPKPTPAKAIEYHVTTGDNAVWATNSKSALSFTFKRSTDDGQTFSHFTGILVDGKAVSKGDYTARSGSVVVELKPAFLSTLSVGKHTLTAQFDDAADATATFTIQAKATPANTPSATPSTTPASRQSAPATGDSTDLAPWIALMVASLIGFVALALPQKATVRR